MSESIKTVRPQQKKSVPAPQTPASPTLEAEAPLPDVNDFSPNNLLQMQRVFGNHATAELVHRAKQNLRTAKPPTDDEHAASEATNDGGEIQRLPSKSDVETQIGKAGFYVLNPTAWAKFLNSLDEFNAAEKKGDKDKQLKAVIKLQTYTNEWIESDKRDTSNKKKQAKDAQKREFLNQLRPNLKILYYELSTKSKTVDVVNQNAADNADENIQLIKEKLLKEGIDNSNETIKAMLARLKSAALTYNFDPNTLNFLLASPDFKTIWQLSYKDKDPSGTIPSEYDKMKGFEKREAAERWLGYDPFTEDQRDNRPAYVGVNVLNNPKGAAPSYGRFFFEFKEGVKSRTTYTPYDTFEMISNTSLKDIPEKTTGSSENMEAILAYNDGVLKVLGNLVNDIQMSEKQIAAAMGRYMEGQVHGALSVDDIDTLVVNYPQDPLLRQEVDKQDAALVEKFLLKYPSVKLRYRS